MSWLDKLLPSQADHVKKSMPSAQNKHHTDKAGSHTNASRTAITFETVLDNSPSPTSHNAYDLHHPPCLEPEILGKLRQHIHDLPAMPETWHQVQRVLQRADASASDLGDVIANDPVLIARVLQTCNSSAYATSASSDIQNISLAIARLGLDETSNIIFHNLAPKLADSPEKNIQARHIWMHSQSISMLMRSLAEPCTMVSRNDASLIGMLHDIGKLVILHIEELSTLAELQASIDAGAPSLEAEHQLLGYTHIDAGVMLALHWKLPKSIHHFISYHHHAAHLPLLDIPDYFQHAMMMLNLAHMILHHHLTQDDATDNQAIWHHYQRRFFENPKLFIKNELNLPLDNPALLEHLHLQIDRIKQTFPDLYRLEKEQ